MAPGLLRGLFQLLVTNISYFLKNGCSVSRQLADTAFLVLSKIHLKFTDLAYQANDRCKKKAAASDIDCQSEHATDTAAGGVAHEKPVPVEQEIPDPDSAAAVLPRAFNLFSGTCSCSFLTLLCECSAAMCLSF